MDRSSGVIDGLCNRVISARERVKVPAHRHHLTRHRHKSLITSTMAHNYPPLSERAIPNTLVLFDVDGTLTPARKVPKSLPRLNS